MTNDIKGVYNPENKNLFFRKSLDIKLIQSITDFLNLQFKKK